MVHAALQQGIGHTSSRIDCKGLLRSRPRVYGTMQKEHMLLQPRMMERYVLMLPAGLTGRMSAYVSSVLSWTFMAPSCLRPLVLVRP